MTPEELERLRRVLGEVCDSDRDLMHLVYLARETILAQRERIRLLEEKAARWEAFGERLARMP